MITQDELKRLLTYDPETGIFTWNISRGGKAKKCSVAGSIRMVSTGKKYIYLEVNGRRRLAHRLVFLYMNGVLPIGEIDHINGNGCDNRFVNLRECSHLENGKNQRKKSNNTSGITGVFWDKRNRRWMSSIQVLGKLKNLGYFDNIESAIAARKEAEIKYNYHANHGVFRPW